MSENEVPKKLLDLVKSEDTALEIARICFENGIKEEKKIKEIGYQTGRVFLGDLPPHEFQKNLGENVKISPFLAGKIAREINDSIFYPVKESLAALYEKGIVSNEKPSIKASSTVTSKEEPKALRKEDVYREPIE